MESFLALARQALRSGGRARVNKPINMTITINVSIDLSQASKDWIMSVLSDAIASVKTSTDAAVARVQTDVAALKAQIAALQATIDAGGATPEDLAALAALKTELDALDPTSPVVLPTP